MIVWVADAGWPEAVDAALAHSPSSAELVLLHVTSGAAEEAGYAAPLGGNRRAPDPAGSRIAADQDAAGMLAAAAARAGNRVVTILRRVGRREREVVAASVGADLLVIARDNGGLSPLVRFVVEHATCPVLLVRRI